MDSPKNGDQMIHSFNDTENSQGNFQGLTKREYFAGLAMQGMLANPSIITMIHNESAMIWIAEHAVWQTDELLKKLEIKK